MVLMEHKMTLTPMKQPTAMIVVVVMRRRMTWSELMISTSCRSSSAFIVRQLSSCPPSYFSHHFSTLPSPAPLAPARAHMFLLTEHFARKGAFSRTCGFRSEKPGGAEHPTEAAPGRNKRKNLAESNRIGTVTFA